MFDYLEDKAFVESVLESGKILFVVRGTVQCHINFTFSPIMGVRISGPTYNLKVIGEKPGNEDVAEIFVNELREEAVFAGEIDLPEKSQRGIARALSNLELWADFLCLAVGNPKIQIEVQTPVSANIGIRRDLDAASFDRWVDYISSFTRLQKTERKNLSGAMWWYRKGCTAAYYSPFDSYTAFWNCLEIMCNVSGSRVREGASVDEAVQRYLQGKKKIKSGNIIECFNRFVSYSIAAQMKDALKRESMLGEEKAKQFVYQCFEVLPEKTRLYQIRNDINHGNIRENSAVDYERVYLRGMLLWSVVMELLSNKLGYPVSTGSDINSLADWLSNPPWRSEGSGSGDSLPLANK